MARREAVGGRVGGWVGGRAGEQFAVCSRIWPDPRAARAAPAAVNAPGKDGSVLRGARSRSMRPPRSGNLWACSACRQARCVIIECGRGMRDRGHVWHRTLPAAVPERSSKNYELLA